MKKTILLAGALVAILVLASVFYNNYPNGNPSGSSDDHSETQQNQSDLTNNEISEQTDETISGQDTSDSEDSASNAIPALDFTVYTKDGSVVKLSDFYGKPIVVNFWATWCGPCKSELPAFEKLYNEYGENIAFLMVNLTDGAQETISGVTDFITKNNYTFPVYYDTELNAASTYGVYSIPATLFIDADGNIVASQLGAMSEQALKNYIETIFTSVE